MIEPEVIRAISPTDLCDCIVSRVFDVFELGFNRFLDGFRIAIGRSIVQVESSAIVILGADIER